MCVFFFFCRRSRRCEPLFFLSGEQETAVLRVRVYVGKSAGSAQASLTVPNHHGSQHYHDIAFRCMSVGRKRWPSSCQLDGVCNCKISVMMYHEQMGKVLALIMSLHLLTLNTKRRIYGDVSLHQFIGVCLREKKEKSESLELHFVGCQRSRRRLGSVLDLFPAAPGLRMRHVGVPQLCCGIVIPG